MGKIKHNLAGYAAIRKDPALISLMSKEGARIADRATSIAGSKKARYEAEAATVSHGRAPRARVSVGAGNLAAIADNARHNTLLKAIGGG